MKPGSAARQAAVAMMNAALVDGQTLAQSGTERLAALPPHERARAQRLATEALRWANRSDRVLGPYLRLRPHEQTLNVLRLGVWEILGDGQDPHGVIDTLVEVAKHSDITRGAAGLVNAVLRNVVRSNVEWGSLPLPELPKPVRKPLVHQYGKKRVQAFEAAHAKGAPLDLSLKSEIDVPGALHLPSGTLRLADNPMVSALPGFSEGAFWVQDAAAAMPAKLANARPGMRVLDMCAAPGGKTLQLAATGAEVVALDVSEQRVERLRENLERTGLRADMIVADALQFETDLRFDLILLDAPCSATGTIRRHPELPYLDPISRLRDALPLQEKMLDHATTLLNHGGKLIYCTCSLLEEEGETQLKSALERHPNLRSVSLGGAAPWIDPDWVTDQGALRLTPDCWADFGGMDGFFIAVLEIGS